MNNGYQKLLSYILVGTMAFTFFPGGTWASGLMYTKQQREAILNAFKEEQHNRIYNESNPFIMHESNLFSTQNTILFFEEMKQQNDERTKILEIERDNIISRAKNLQEAIDLLDADIEEAQDELTRLSSDILSTYRDIQQTQKEIDDIDARILENRKILVEYIAHIYKKENLYYSAENKDIDSLKVILLSEGSIGDMLNDFHFSALLEATGQSLVEQYRQLLAEKYIQKLTLEVHNRKLKEEKSTQVQLKKNLVEKKEFREKLLEYTKGQEQLYEEFVLERQRADESIKQKIEDNKMKLKNQKTEVLAQFNCEYIDEDINFNEDMSLILSDSVSKDCKTLNQILTLEGQLAPFDTTTQNIFQWPVEPNRGLSSYYKDPEYRNYVGSDHEGLDIPTSQGTDIIAPADGYVTFVKKPVDEGYAYMALKHANGYVTIYGHINEVMVEQFDFVKAGEVFARSGGEVGTNGAGLMTTGPHLHFELQRNGMGVDPLDHLDMMKIKETQVPKTQKYAYKYAQDFKEYTGEEYDGILKNVLVFKLKGETEIERQKYLLSTYASPAFTNWNMWVEEAMAGDIDPSFLMCIGLAESSLGNNLKTSYNVGNVGNTDSGGTWDFPDARTGVHWIVKTLNNKFLGEYSELQQLSGYGNRDGAIYASSPINWHNNMTKCLQALKDTHIPDSFEFRTGGLSSLR